MRSNLRTTPNDQTQLLSYRHGDDTRWATPTTPTVEKNHDQEDHDHHIRKSVLARVRKKAKKWRQILVKKKRGQDTATPAWGVSLDDNYEEEETEYLRAPMYESELAPEGCKEVASQHPREVSVIAEKHVLVASVSPPKDEDKENPSTNKTITESVSEKLAPAYAMVSEAAQTIASKIQGVVTTREEMSGREHKWDKGVSVKEYLMQKLEPGEEERALSQVISEAMSPKKAPEDTGVVEKVREALSSMLGMESSSSTTTTATNTPSIPLSTNAQEVVEEENHGRILQAN